jgi:hypothetical protein
MWWYRIESCFPITYKSEPTQDIHTYKHAYIHNPLKPVRGNGIYGFPSDNQVEMQDDFVQKMYWPFYTNL